MFLYRFNLLNKKIHSKKLIKNEIALESKIKINKDLNNFGRIIKFR